MLTDILEADLGQFKELSGTRYKVRLIEGNRLGSSGYYPAETLLRDGPRIFKKGTPMYIDHQTPDEKVLKPFGSIDTYAGELAEDAYYDGDGLYAEVEVFEHQAPKIKALKDKIGISIRARGKTIAGNINGKSVPVFTELTEARSADFVVKAGAGGKIMQILESAVEDSEADSEAQEERDENMDEVLAAIAGLKSDFDARLTAVEESVKAVKPADDVADAQESEADPIEIAEALTNSKLDKDGRVRVLELHKATKKPLAELIAAEESYIEAHQKSDSEDTDSEEGSVETDDQEAEESATFALPSAWQTKKDK